MLRKLLTGLCAMAGLGAACAAIAGDAGHVVFVTGQVQVAGHALVLDDAVKEGDELSTGADGYVYVKTIDNGFLILRPNSKAHIVTYHIDADNPGNTRVKLELQQGVARSISGEGVKKARQNFRFNTPVAAIGVRGTDFIVFTDEQTSRVAVVSGGVIVAGFAGACGPEGGGPCEGGRELFAGQSGGALLQVQRGQNIPQLLHSPSLTPDQSVPPRSDEPIGKVSAVLNTSPLEVNLDAQKGSNPLLVVKPAQTTDSSSVSTPPAVVSTPPPPPPPPVVTTPVASPAKQEVLWGRWEVVAGSQPNAAILATLNNGQYNNGLIIGAYVIKRLTDTALVMPKDGNASFVLSGGEGYIQPNGKEAMAASVQNGRLDINFGARTFSTDLSLVAAKASMNITGVGEITLDGQLVSTPLSGSIIRGYLGGPNAQEAAYIFKSADNPNMTGTGATRWSR